MPSPSQVIVWTTFLLFYPYWPWYLIWGTKTISCWGIPRPTNTPNLELICQALLELSIGQQFFCFGHNDLYICRRGSQNNRLLRNPKTNSNITFGVDMPSASWVITRIKIAHTHTYTRLWTPWIKDFSLFSHCSDKKKNLRRPHWFSTRERSKATSLCQTPGSLLLKSFF